mgnify:CR=1 FL=1|tara:strand:+ start:6508 stop:6864 length:357 start_codon:yes stop_codon:yes gene_type:complete
MYLALNKINLHQQNKATLNNGEEIWQKLIRIHKNIQFVLSGHIWQIGVGRLVSKGGNGNKIFQLVSNYQFMENGGNGYLRIMKFSPSKKRVEVKTYSPYLDKYKTDPNNQFVIDLGND